MTDEDDTEWVDINLTVQQRDYNLLMGAIGYGTAMAARANAHADVERYALLQYLLAHTAPLAFAESVKLTEVEVYGPEGAQDPIEAMGLGPDGAPKMSQTRELLLDRGYDIPTVSDEVREEIGYEDIDIS